MDAAQRAFLSDTLGEPAAEAMERAAARDARVAGVLVPRAALALVMAAGSYAGPPLSFAKSGSGYDGVVSVRGKDYGFSRAGPAQVAGALALALGVRGVPRGVDPEILRRLGKSLDALVTARRRRKAKKTEAPGGAAGPKPQLSAGVPTTPALAPARNQRSVRVAKSEAGRGCPLCHRAQMSEASFVGCLCFRDLQKSVTVAVDGDSYVLEFGEEWDGDAVASLEEALGG